MAELAGTNIWRNCNICKKGIEFGAEYFLCNVSTCNRKRMGLFFCSLGCFEAHVPMERHRDAWAEKEKAPSQAAWEASQSSLDAAPQGAEPSTLASPAPARTAVPQPAATRRVVSSTEQAPEVTIDVLVVVSKLKKYVKDWSGMNTSDGAISVLSDHLRELCREATRQAGLDGRRTVLDRDFAKVLERTAR